MGRSPGRIGRQATSTWRASTASCSCAAGRCTSSDTSSTFLRSRRRNSRASLAEVVVLPEPCNPTIITTTGGTALRSSPSAEAPPSISTRWSWTIFTTIGAGVTERLLAHAVDEILDHQQRDVGLEQRDADLAQRRVDVVLGQRAVAAQPVEDVVEAVAQAFEHVDPIANADGASARHSRTGRPLGRIADASTEAAGR